MRWTAVLTFSVIIAITTSEVYGQQSTSGPFSPAGSTVACARPTNPAKSSAASHPTFGTTVAARQPPVWCWASGTALHFPT
ncbi:MAG: hypothetical protein IPH59_05215 [bacterium]|nr:hypothetical protein [bacterium]